MRGRAFRPAQHVQHNLEPTGRMKDRPIRVLIVDLNNFAAFPTLTIGILVAALRKTGHQVRVLCPLAHGVPAIERERQETWFDQVKRRVHMTENPALSIPRNFLRSVYYAWTERAHRSVVGQVEREMKEEADVILLSAYFQHFQTVRAIGRLARSRSVPVLLGGPMFNNSTAVEVWRRIPGLTAVVGAESDLQISALVSATCARGGLMNFSGITLPSGRSTRPAPPLRDLDRVPMADFSDFPWDRYRVRVVPIMTGRGCQWDRCTFCSDVVTVSGRTFRTRSVQNVLLEMQEQSRRCATSNFVFLDLKLNSFPDMFRGIASDVQRYVFGAEWVGTVHVDLRKDNGLSREDLKAAALGGMRRINFGLESGSQNLLDRMEKGTNVERNSEFIHNAFEVGLSIRCSLFKGYPGETAEDVFKTARFIEDHMLLIDRIRLSDFSLLEDTPVYNDAKQGNCVAQQLKITKLLKRKAKAKYVINRTNAKEYSRAVNKILALVHEINRRPLRISARQFDGLM